MKVLQGIRVLDLSIAMAGPLATQKLADLGADVIKVEPLTGEWQRHVAAGGARGNQVNASFLSLNRNKRSLSLNLKSPAGREVLYQLVRTADVFLQNYRPGVAGRLGVDYETLRALKPDLVYVSMSGYGESGPYTARPGQDVLLQAMSGGLASARREGEPPRPAPFFMADAFTGYSAFEGAMAALFHRERTGEGQLVEVNMLDAVIAAQMQELSISTVGKIAQQPSAEIHAHSYIRAPYGIFPTADDFVALAFAEMNTLAKVFDDDRFLAFEAERDGFTHRDQISALVTENLATPTPRPTGSRRSAPRGSGWARFMTTNSSSTTPRSSTTVRLSPMTIPPRELSRHRASPSGSARNLRRSIAPRRSMASTPTRSSPSSVSRRNRSASWRPGTLSTAERRR